MKRKKPNSRKKRPQPVSSLKPGEKGQPSEYLTKHVLYTGCEACEYVLFKFAKRK